MKNLLKITSSVFDAGNASGVSTQLVNELVDRLQLRAEELGSKLELAERDLAATAVPHLDAGWLQALSTPADERSEEQAVRVAFSDTLIAELQQADILVLAAPMYNFTVPSTLKAWIDHVARAGVTFRYTENGSQGLLQNRKVYLVTTTGGLHEPGISDFVRPYLKTALGLLGLKDIEFITAGGLNMGPEARAKGLQEAAGELERAVLGADGLFTETGPEEAAGRGVA